MTIAKEYIRSKVILTYQSKVRIDDKPLDVTCWNANDPILERLVLIDLGMEIRYNFVKATVEWYTLTPKWILCIKRFLTKT